MITAVDLQFKNQQAVLSFPQELLAMDYVQAFLERLKLESLLEKSHTLRNRHLVFLRNFKKI